MGKLIAIVVAFGVLIGLALPTGKPIAAPATATGAAKEVVLTRGSTGHFFTDATINDRGSVEFMVDTGASFVALTVETPGGSGSTSIRPISTSLQKAPAVRCAGRSSR